MRLPPLLHTSFLNTHTQKDKHTHLDTNTISQQKLTEEVDRLDNIRLLDTHAGTSVTISQNPTRKTTVPTTDAGNNQLV